MYYHIFEPSIIAFPRRAEQIHQQLGAEYAQVRSHTTREEFVNEQATGFTQLSRVPYFSIVDSSLCGFRLVLDEEEREAGRAMK